VLAHALPVEEEREGKRRGGVGEVARLPSEELWVGEEEGC
jgi:hypothetical protein